MPKKVAVMLDGGHLRIYANRANKTFDPAYIEKIAHGERAAQCGGSAPLHVLRLRAILGQQNLTLPDLDRKK